MDASRTKRTQARAASAMVGSVLAILAGCRGEPLGPGTIEGAAVPEKVIASRAAAQKKSATSISRRVKTQAPADEILFGDLHVHTTFSADAFLMNLPIMQGEGVHPVADACDFARYCSALDFWSITDHAESLTPRRWRDTIETARRCEAVGAGSGVPDLITYLGWEWTQIGLTAEEHYGHRNVILKDLEDGKIPGRPVAAAAFSGQAMRDKPPLAVRYGLPNLDWKNRDFYLDFLEFMNETREVPECPAGVHAKEVKGECMDFAATPSDLFAKIDEWGVTSTVIPHGTAWGIYTPPGYTIDKSLKGAQHDPNRQRLVEVFSGHGNSEELRSWREATRDAEGRLVCPAPTKDYEPCCWRAGEIIRSRCGDVPAAECDRRVEDARRNYLAAGASGRLTVPGADVVEWGACGQCLDCFDPAFEYRPGGSVQYAMALTDFSDPASTRSFRFGFLASSDNHSARPGTGYKEFDRGEMTESFGPRSEFWREQTRPLGDAQPESEPVDPKSNRYQRYQLIDFERGSSFFYTGGLVAVHTPRRDREAVWKAMQDRHVYGTSGERILLWFDLLRDGAEIAPMGSEVEWSGKPRFRVRAVGSFKQKPGCPDFAARGLPAARLESLCGGECYNPGDERHRISRLEVVRIRPQVRPGEPVGDLVEDPWKTLPCAGEAIGCVGEFEDPDFAAGGRDVLYYVRAIQEATPAVNAGGLRCVPGADGRCAEVKPCYGDWRTDAEDDCLAANEERAWSSPIFLDWKAAAQPGAQPAGAEAAPR